MRCISTEYTLHRAAYWQHSPKHEGACPDHLPPIKQCLYLAPLSWNPRSHEYTAVIPRSLLSILTLPFFGLGKFPHVGRLDPGLASHY